MQNVILQPIEVGGQTFKNRIMFPPLTTGYEKNGMISEQDMGFYTRLAKGGVGYIVMGDVAPINSFSPTPKLFDDSQIPAFKALADSVHAYGTKLGVQLFHPEYDVDAINSLFMQKKFDEMRQRLHHDMMFFTDEVSEEMLMAIIDKMCACAVRAQKAGVDVIQIHGDRLNGCLCSTRMNHRTDKFGGSLENRVRFARMLTRAIRKAVPDMVIDYKLSIVTPQRGKGGIDEADAVQFAQWLVEDGVDMFHVAQANHTGNMADTIPPMGVQPYGFFVKIAGDIKKAVNVPVSAVGRIVDAEMAARVIESGMADMVAMGRPLLADPDWGTKIAAGKACDIRRCISCNKGCTDAIQNRQFLSCVLNAENGYENTRSHFTGEGDTCYCPQCGEQVAVSTDASQHIYSWFVDAVIVDFASYLADQDGKVWDDLSTNDQSIYLNRIQKGGYHIYTTLDMDVQKQVDAVYTDLSNIPTTRSEQQLQSAIVVINNETGDVVALSGGKIVDYDVNVALSMHKYLDPMEIEVAQAISI